MNQPHFSRRQVLKGIGLASSALASTVFSFGSQTAQAAEKPSGVFLSSNQYSWMVYYRRENREFLSSLDTGFADIAASGLNGFEAIVTDPAFVDQISPPLKKHGLQLPSIYVNSSLHEKGEADKSIEQILIIAEKAKDAGTRIIVTNPNPIRWGGPEDKSDDQLKIQAEAMNRLGQKLRDLDIALAYHNHDPELRNAAREFHHMMLGTDSEYVTLGLDAHWIYRGSGNSQIALFDVVKLYGNRITEVHLRQSQDGVWSETFGEGDIDYSRLAKELLEIGVKPLLVMEQANEEGTPHTLNPVEVHRRSAEYARKVFRAFT